MDKPQFKKGQVVPIYQDPYSCEKLEGNATLKRCVCVTNDGERWEVNFEGDAPPETYQRMIIFDSIIQAGKAVAV